MQRSFISVQEVKGLPGARFYTAATLQAVTARKTAIKTLALIRRKLHRTYLIAGLATDAVVFDHKRQRFFSVADPAGNRSHRTKCTPGPLMIDYPQKNSGQSRNPDDHNKNQPYGSRIPPGIIHLNRKHRHNEQNHKIPPGRPPKKCRNLFLRR